jgi:hypothetical protein
VLLDADIAGCVLSFIRNKGELDDQRTAILGLCYRELPVVMKDMDGEANLYFARLETLAGIVLRALAKESD